MCKVFGSIAKIDVADNNARCSLFVGKTHENGHFTGVLATTTSAALSIYSTIRVVWV